ncbi:MAG: carbohydrate binding family 9 domain-containing protein [Acidobacteria bacterium]|nr:carbohydrate binding family 9 domain-containing protein [Acidobacteriota bacterium]
MVDGNLDDEAWRSAAVFKDFFQTSPGNNIAPSKPTEVYMAYDEHYLYIAFKCWDDRDKIRATVAKRDDVFGEDNVRIWLDTYNDQRRAYLLGFNPLGIQQDGIVTEGSFGPDFSVDIVMESKGAIHDWGWAVEAKIPFKSLRYASAKKRIWGFNVARNIDRFNDEMDQWLPDDRNVSGTLIKHGKISGIDDIKYERTLEVVPSVTVSQTRERVADRFIASGRMLNRPVKADIGVNLKFTLTPNITFDAAINPDYAEIEADAPVVSANRRFPIFFEEKRPFFLEGKEIFDSSLSPFYSRTIVDPDFAAKLTGKTGKVTFGFLAASDNAPGNYSEDERTANRECLIRQQTDPTVVCPIDQFLDKNALFGVLRLKRDFGGSNYLGFFGTARTFPKSRNFVGGFDGRYKLDGATVFSYQVLGSHSRKNFYEPETDHTAYRTGNGLAYNLNLDHTRDTTGWTIGFEGKSPDYRSDAGFTNRTDTNNFFAANRFSTKSRSEATLIRLNWRQSASYTFDWSGRVQEANVETSIDTQLQGNLSLSAEVGLSYEHLYEEEFGAKRNVLGTINGAFFGAPERHALQPAFSFSANKQVNSKFSIFGSARFSWNRFDYDFGSGNRYNRVSPAYVAWIQGGMAGPYPALDPGTGSSRSIDFGIELKPTNALRFSLDYSNSRLHRSDTDQLAFESNLFTLHSTYQFTRFAFLRTRLDYDSLDKNAKGQVLFGWTPNPGTAFYVGYNDDFNYNGYNRFTDLPQPGFERNGRTVFIRMSYLFRKSF